MTDVPQVAVLFIVEMVPLRLLMYFLLFSS
jgi:hypothetical protein